MRQIKLEMKIGEKILRSWDLCQNEEYIIGRSSETSNICIEHSSLSRNHAKISVASSGSVVIQDLNSKNGTFVDGKKINSNQLVLLRVGTQIHLGEHPQEFTLSETFVESPNLKEKNSNSKKNKKIKEERSRSRSNSKSKNEGNKKNEQKSKNFERSSGKKDKPRERNQEKDNKEKQKEHLKATAIVKKSLLWNKPADVKPCANLSNITLQSFDANLEEKLKFLKLMGVKSDENLRELLPEKPVQDEKTHRGVKNLIDKQVHMKEDLEKQFNAGLQRKDGRKVGLGYSE